MGPPSSTWRVDDCVDVSWPRGGGASWWRGRICSSYDGANATELIELQAYRQKLSGLHLVSIERFHEQIDQAHQYTLGPALPGLPGRQTNTIPVLPSLGMRCGRGQSAIYCGGIGEVALAGVTFGAGIAGGKNMLINIQACKEKFYILCSRQ